MLRLCGNVYTVFLLIILRAARAQVFTLVPIQYEPACGLESGQGNFTIEIDLDFPDVNRVYFEDIVRLVVTPTNETEDETVDGRSLISVLNNVELCAINITTCALPASDAMDVCYCQKLSSGKYKIYTRTRPSKTRSFGNLESSINIKPLSFRPPRKRRRRNKRSAVQEASSSAGPALGLTGGPALGLTGINEIGPWTNEETGSHNNDTGAGCLDLENLAMTVFMGTLPPVYAQREDVIPSIVDGNGNVVPLTSDLYVCRNEYMTLTFCAGNVTEGTELRCSDGGCQEVRTTCECLDYHQKFTFVNRTSYVLEFSYQEVDLCPRNHTYSVNVYEKDCSGNETTVPPPDPDTWTGCRDGATNVTVVNRELQCDSTTDGGGWIVVQRRSARSCFLNKWNRYMYGFGLGNWESSFWVGLNRICYICNAYQNNLCELRIEMTSQGDTYVAKYAQFGLFNKTEKYRILVEDYDTNSTAVDALETGVAFSTKDQDNDDSPEGSCAQNHKGAWWYSNCGNSNLNGMWYASNDAERMFWGDIIVDATQIKVRPRVLNLND